MWKGTKWFIEGDISSYFDTIDHVVNDKLPKKYEWQAAFGLSFTILWLYLKVLDLLITIAGNNNKD